VRNYKLKLGEEEEAARKECENSETCRNVRMYNFITESFFLTLYLSSLLPSYSLVPPSPTLSPSLKIKRFALHVGIITTGNYYIELNQTLGRILDRKKQVQAMLQTQFTEHAVSKEKTKRRKSRRRETRGGEIL
jgi:hypothetical protein